MAGRPTSIARSRLRSMERWGASQDHSVCTWRSGGGGIGQGYKVRARDKSRALPTRRCAPPSPASGEGRLSIEWPAVGWVVLGISYAVGAPLLAIGLYIVLRGSFPGWWMEWMLWPVKYLNAGIVLLQVSYVVRLGRTSVVSWE